jgi:four helix bundle protein
MGTKGFEHLEVWQKSHKMVLEIYKLTKTFSDEERFGLISQMRRSAVSVAANIAEGYRKKGKKDKLNFYNIAQGSLDELKYYLILSKDLGYLNDLRHYIDLYEEIIRMLTTYMKKINGGSEG